VRANLLAAPQAVLSHRSAAAMHRLEGFGSGRIEMTVPRGKRAVGTSAIVHQARDLQGADVVRIRGLPVTSIERTIIDLARVVDEDTLRKVVDEVLRRKKTSVKRLRARLGRMKRPPAPIVNLVATLTSMDEGRESALEDAFIALLKRAKLPLPVRQFALYDGRRKFASADLGYPNAGIVIELVSNWHTGQAVEKDSKRYNRMALLGLALLQFTWDQVHREPDETIDTVRSALAQRDPLMRAGGRAAAVAGS
jgi:hypothetical protein